MTSEPPSPAARGSRREEVLALLQGATEPVSITDVAEALGVHRNTARFHLDRLVEARRAETVAPERRAPGRPPALYRAARHMDPSGPRAYRELASVLVHALANGPDTQARAVEAGRAWGRRVAPRMSDAAAGRVPEQQMVRMLDAMGFAPGAPVEGPATGRPSLIPATATATAARSRQVPLRSCPFLEVAVQRPEVVCAVHLGLMRGALEGWGTSTEVTRLEPFATPETCLVHLSTPGGS